MVKHTQTIRRQSADELVRVFDHFVGLALKGLGISLSSQVMEKSLASVLKTTESGI